MASELKTNLRVLKRSNKKPEPGDVFAMQLPDDRYLFGRVALADLPRERAPMPGSYLIYIYRHRSEVKLPAVEALTPDQLLISPIFINRMGWTKGYFETVVRGPLKPNDLLGRHCFRSALTGGYKDEAGNQLSGPVEPCGDWALFSYRRVDDLISDALGIGRVPDEA